MIQPNPNLKDEEMKDQILSNMVMRNEEEMKEEK